MKCLAKDYKEMRVCNSCQVSCSLKELHNFKCKRKSLRPQVKPKIQAVNDIIDITRSLGMPQTEEQLRQLLNEFIHPYTEAIKRTHFKLQNFADEKLRRTQVTYGSQQYKIEIDKHDLRVIGQITNALKGL